MREAKEMKLEAVYPRVDTIEIQNNVSFEIVISQHARAVSRRTCSLQKLDMR